MYHKIFTQIDKSKDEMLNLWEKLVNIDCGSSNKKGVDTIIEIIKTELVNIGFDCKVYQFEKAGNTLVAKKNGVKEEDKIVLLGHADTVFPEGTATLRPFKIKDGKAYGPGVLDMKGGIAQIIYACKALMQTSWPKRSIQIIVAGDEELGHINSNAADLIISECKNAKAVFCCESGRLDGNLVIGRKGVGRLRLEVEGISAHAGNEPEKGANAILEIAQKITKIKGLEKLYNGITINVGVIQGGIAVNVVPNKAWADIDIRFNTKEEYDKLISNIESIIIYPDVEKTKCTLESVVSFQPMVTTEGVCNLFKFVNDTSLELGFEQLGTCKSGGGADSAYSVIAGAPTVCAMGPKGAMNHSPEEFAEVESLLIRTKLLAACMLKL